MRSALVGFAWVLGFAPVVFVGCARPDYDRVESPPPVTQADPSTSQNRRPQLRRVEEDKAAQDKSQEKRPGEPAGTKPAVGGGPREACRSTDCPR